MVEIPRRRFLQSLSTLSIVSLGGCGAVNLFSSDSSSPSTPQIGRLQIVNSEQTGQTIDVEIHQPDSIALWKTYTVAEAQTGLEDVERIDLDAYNESQPFTIRVRRRDTGEWHTLTSDEIAEKSPGACLDVIVHIQDGAVTIGSTADTGYCSSAGGNATMTRSESVTR